MKLALIQLTSGADINANIARVRELVAQAAKKGAQFIATPENTFFMAAPLPASPRKQGEGIKKYTQDQHPGVHAAAQMAKKHKVWLLVGSVSVIPSEAEGSKKDPSTRLRLAQDDKRKTYNRSVLFNPEGGVAAHYDKIHLFDVEVGDGQVYKESARMLAGEKAVVAEIVPSASCLVPSEEKNIRGTRHEAQGTLKLGMSVCYDVRFPQLYRALAKQGAQMLAVPSAFTQVTGEAHWHVLLRARAIENGCFVIAPAQCGTHPGKRKTYGHSLIINPWGKILADGGTDEGVVMAEIDLGEVKKARGRIPSLQHDRKFRH